MLRAVSHSIDLHCHSACSDGVLSPSDLLSFVANTSVKTLAITDHDSLGAHQQLANHPALEEVNLIPGIEISCSSAGREIHVVGLQLDLESPQLHQFVSQQQAARVERLLAYCRKLEQLGLPDLSEAVQSLESESPTRAHLAQLMVAHGIVGNFNQAFKHYLGRKGKAYLPASWPDMSSAVEVINQAKGIAVLAHPSRYELSKRQLKELLEQFTRAGGRAVELSFPNIDPQFRGWLKQQAVSLGLAASQGSDFHSPEWRWSQPGRFPPLPKEVTPVWELWS